MATRARIVDGPFPADVGPGMLLSFGGSFTNDLSQSFLVSSLAEVEAVSLASLREVAARLEREDRRRTRGEPGRAHRTSIGLVHQSDFLQREIDDPQASYIAEEIFDLPRDPTVSIEGGRVFVHFAYWREEEPDAKAVERRLAPYLARSDAVAEVTTGPQWQVVDGWRLDVKIDRDFPRGATFGDAWHLGDDAKTLLGIVDGDEIPHSIAIDLIRGRRHGAFKGQPESGWLEAKGAPYADANRRLGKNWKYELAKDVAAFANSPEGGIIVIGMTTEDEGDGEVITGFREFDLKRVTAASYGNHVAQLVHPRVEGFEVVRVPGRERGRGIVALVIPPQDASNLPFLVRGVVRDGDVLGNHVLWPVRQGDQTALVDADGLHSRLRLGDQVIRRSE
jgi:hypothetical protein